MARLPDRFDHWIRKAKESEDAARQADYVLGALAGLKEWHFLNLGSTEKPQAARTEIETEPYLLVFSDTTRIEEMVRERGLATPGVALPVITVPAEAALTWAVECRTGLFINPPEDAALVPFAHVEAFHAEWKKRDARQAAGFWIPNMTSEEEDFCQQHGY